MDVGLLDGLMNLVMVVGVGPDQERLKQLHGEDYILVAVAAKMGKAEKTCYLTVGS
jgi:hypothetical protein